MRSCSAADDRSPAAAAVICPDLLARFAGVSDGRSDQGRVHPVAVVLALCAAAVVAGMCSFTAIAGWVVDVPAALLAQLYGGRAEAPSKATIWRVVTGADAVAVDAVIGVWLAGQAAAPEPAAPEPAASSSALVAIAVDGKTVRGATDAEGNQVHLLAAATHEQSLVLGQVEVGAKTNEIPMFAPLLETLAATGIDLATTVITADALHSQRSHAEYLHSRGAEFVLTVKGEPARPLHGPRRAALGEHPDRSPRRRYRPRPGHHPHHPRTARPRGPAVPARQPGLADRTLHLRPRRQPTVRGRRARRDQPEHQPRRPRPAGHPGPPALGRR
ncbi:MAG: ISAs1 family transposase, partial [Actinobacteria bacterium]|nr:ISAs1 family transposase [Actinomycetota bacterium]